MNKYPELIKLRGQILASGRSFRDIAAQAGVTYETVRFIASGDANNTSLATMHKILDACRSLKRRRNPAQVAG